jgi:uncharacterized protein YbjT (DUF2867 family)
VKIAVAGGTGVVGSYTVDAAAALGHDVTVLSRQRGVDVLSGSGLSAAMQGVHVVIDTLNTPNQNASKASAFFTTAASELQRAAADAGVGHIVTVSIVGIERAPSGYYQAKLAHEKAATAGPVPATIVRATQFFEFPAQVMSRSKRGPVALMARGKTQPVAARAVGQELADVATAAHNGGRVEVAGPQVFDLADLARRVLTAQGSKAWVIAFPLPGVVGKALKSGGLLATPATRIIGPTFDQWLASDDARRISV